MDKIYINGRAYAPKEDITPYELARMLELFALGIAGAHDFDFWAFITENGLERHFEEDAE